MTIGISLTFILAVIAIIMLWRLGKRQPSNLDQQFTQLKDNLERTERLLREEIGKNRMEQTQGLNSFGTALSSQVTGLTEMNANKLEQMRESVERQLKSLQEDNSQKLEQMRATVDEKLHATLEKRLGESFQMVSDRLEKVHQGLGEMQNLAAGVGDLKKVLANVKTRGTWGEAQLGNLLDQVLTQEQYERNCITKHGSRDPVEFAIKMPGQGDHVVYMPIDSKFPTEDYERLESARDAVNPAMIEEAGKALEARIKLEAKNIRDKYIDPPHTTDFGILFLPAEALYAEVLRRPGLADNLRREFKVIVTGPTTIAALLSSLHMGFRTLAVEKRASEVWGLLGTVKTEFGKFGDLLEKTKEKLESAGKNIDEAARKSRTIERKLRDVQELPGTAAAELLE